MRFVVIRIGCLECHEPSEFLSSHETLAAATETHPDALIASDATWSDWRSCGDPVAVIFDTTGK
jgi:hypothetical protein